MNNRHMSMKSEADLIRGPALRAKPMTELFDALRDTYGIEGLDGASDLGGSSNLNLLVTASEQRYVVRVYRPWVTAGRLTDIQLARRELDAGGVPSARPLKTRDGHEWIVIEDRLVEVERYVDHDADMDSWERLAAGLPLLGRVHTLLRPLKVGADGKKAPAANHIESHDALPWTLRGTRRIREWKPSADELQLADASEELARLVGAAERDVVGQLTRQLVHGDFWDNNVLFRNGQVVLVTDLDFMGERARIDDLALTLYYTNSTFTDDQLSGDRMRRLRALVDAYDSGLADRLTQDERAALPLALARTPLCFIGMISVLDSELRARALAAQMRRDIEWAVALARAFDPWQEAFTRRTC